MTDIFGDTTRAELQREIDRLRAELAQRTAERDGARREICLSRCNPENQLTVAAKRGWDCFDAKEGQS